MKAIHKATLIGNVMAPVCASMIHPRSHIPHIELMRPHDCNDGNDTQPYSFQ